jgi:hypothetical protein
MWGAGTAYLKAIVRAAVPEVADQLLLLRVDGDQRLAGRLRRLHLRVDVLELRVSIGMARSSLNENKKPHQKGGARKRGRDRTGLP